MDANAYVISNTNLFRHDDLIVLEVFAEDEEGRHFHGMRAEFDPDEAENLRDALDALTEQAYQVRAEEAQERAFSLSPPKPRELEEEWN